MPAIEQRHQQRIKDDADFNYVRESARLIAEADRDVIELQIDKRKTQLETWRQATLKLENARRKAKGLPEYDDSIFERLESDELPPPEPKQTEEERKEALYSDMYLIESGRVLIDFIGLLEASGFYQEGVRKVTHSSAAVGWMPRVASNDDFVAPAVMATASP